MTGKEKSTPMLVEKSVREFLTELGASSPTPGGGAASALGASLAGQLLLMVAALTVQKEPEKAEALRPAQMQLMALAEACTRLVDRDAQAYERVRAAYRLPKEHEDEAIKRAMEVQLAMREATLAPLELAETCVEMLDVAADVLRLGRLSAISDAGTSGFLGLAAAMGALLNVESNLPSIDDQDFATSVGERVARVQARSQELFERNQQLLAERRHAQSA
jgi:methenyltetrahydrofolate cyclohydrolase